MTLPALRERPRRYATRPALRESELVRLWQTQQLPPEALVTDGGDELHVVYRGRHGAGPGPDFRDAIVGTAGAELIKGDIELHVRSSDFVRHGHHLDRAYTRLALHVVFIHDAGPTALLDGRTIPTIALERWVRRRAGELRAVLAGPDEYREPCHTAVTRLGSAAALAALSDLGGVRLRTKAAALAPDIARDGPDQSLYLALARALGLTRNVEPTAAVARHLPLAELRAVAGSAAEPALVAEAALLGAGGLLDGQFLLWPATGELHEEQLLAAWQRTGLAPCPGLGWAAGPQRPGAGPRERLRGLAGLALRDGPPLDATKADWLALLTKGPKALLAALEVAGAIGQDRACELAINAVLPWLLAMYANDADACAAVNAIFGELPAPTAYGQTKLIAAALSGDDGKSLLRGAAAMQGALQMTRDWCTQGGCGRCPLS